MKKLIIYNFLFLICTIAYAQKYNFRNFSLEDGLSQSQVYAITQSQDGNMWFGTHGGAITITNGISEKYFTTNDGLPDYQIWDFLPASDGKIWIGTSNGIAYYDGYQIVNYPETESQTINDIIEDKDKNIWFSSDSGIYIFKNNKIEQFETKLYSSASIFCDSKNNIWYYSYFGISQIKNNKSYNIENSDDIYGTVIFEDNEQNMWFGTENGLYCYKNEEFTLYTTKDGLPGNNIVDITQDAENNIWLATESSGISIFNGKTFLNINAEQGIGFDYVTVLYRDNNNNIWLGTDGGGACMFIDFTFIQQNFDSNSGNNFIMSAFVDSKQNLWVGSDGAGIFTNQTGEFLNISEKDGLVGNYVYGIIETKNGDFWFATYEGLSKYDGKNFTNYTTLNSVLGTDYLIVIFEDNENNIWIGTNGVGMLKFANDEFTIYDENTGFDATSVWDFYTTKDNKLYIATENGLFVFSEKDSLHYTTEDGLGVNGIGAIIEDDKGIIWLGTDIGISRFDGENFINYDKKDGLSSEICYFIIFDKNNYMIAGTEKGIDKIKFDDAGNIISIKNYGKDEGFMGIECNQNAVAQDAQGILYIGTMDGLMIYNPLLKNEKLHEPIVNITNIKLFYEETDWLNYTDSLQAWNLLPENLILPYNKNNITFEFVGIDFTNPEKVKYQFKLEGFDKEWMPLTKNNFATYSNIPPGKFAFLIKAVTNNGVWNTETAEFYFVIKPPFWKTFWFYLISGLGLFGLIFFIFHLRTRQLKKAKIKLGNKVKERTAEVMQQNEEILTQRDEIELQRDTATKQRDQMEKQKKDITDSIVYAKRIQTALLPGQENLMANFSEYFIFYRPRNIVSGDFYWLKVVQRKNNTYKLFAVADCTGHGVPGAFMSLLGTTFLNEIVNHSEITTTSQVLEELRERIIRSLKQTNEIESTKDGIDIVLCCYNTETNILQCSGANNSAIIIKNRKNSFPNCIVNKDEKKSITTYDADNKALFIKPIKNPIGIYIKHRKFVTHEIKLEKNDIIYLFTDGYIDQFSGVNREKFKMKPFKKLILRIHEKPMEEQKQILEETFNNWRTNPNAQKKQKLFPQIDDVLVAGFKI